MKKKATNWGLYLIIIGTLVLVLTRISILSTYNWLLVTGLLCIVIGIVLQIRSIKHESKY
jgi:membrane-bound ClpP family serine protease